MSTFLQLVQDVARESGTVPNIGDPTTLLGATGRNLRIVNWVRDAYTDIQNDRADWRWLEAEFSGQTISGTQEYNSAAMGISSRFSKWIFDPGEDDGYWSIYLTSDGVAEEGLLQYRDWHYMRRHILIGTQSSAKPVYITVRPDQSLVLYPTPDAAYTIRGRYYKAPQTLSVDADTPEMPAQFHRLIQWKALMLMGAFDEAMEQMPAWTMEYQRIMQKLVTHQSPRVKLGGPLA